MSDVGKEMIEGLEQLVQDLKDGKPLKMTSVRKVRLSKLLQEQGWVISMSESRRIIAMGAVTINGVNKGDMGEEVFIRTGDVLTVGRRRFVVDEQGQFVEQGGFTPRTQVTKIEPAEFD